VKYIAEFTITIEILATFQDIKQVKIYQHLVGSGNVFIRNLFSSGAFFHQEPFFIKSVFSSGAFCCQEPFIIKNLFSSETFFIQEAFFLRNFILLGMFFIQEGFFHSLGPLLFQECFCGNLLAGAFYPVTFFREPFGIGSLFHRNFICRNVSMGTFWQERFGRNVSRPRHIKT
jgi:hypothetical protein